MKKVTVEGVLEEAKYFCDKHPERECFSELKIASWYGSKFDMMGLELHLCDACLFDMYKQFQQQFGKDPKEIEI